MYLFTVTIFSSVQSQQGNRVGRAWIAASSTADRRCGWRGVNYERLNLIAHVQLSRSAFSIHHLHFQWTTNYHYINSWATWACDKPSPTSRGARPGCLGLPRPAALLEALLPCPRTGPCAKPMWIASASRRRSRRRRSRARATGTCPYAYPNPHPK